MERPVPLQEPVAMAAGGSKFAYIMATVVLYMTVESRAHLRVADELLELSDIGTALAFE